MKHSEANLVGHIFTIGAWTFEIKSIVARKTEEYGQEFTGVANINIVDGEIHVEGLHCDNFTRSDYKDIKQFAIDTLGFDKLEYSRYRFDGQRRKVHKV